MSTQYNGIAANVSPGSAFGILSSTNANPIVIQTSVAHLLTTGDKVRIYGHQVNTNANGEYQVTVIDPTHFSIPKAGNGAGAATGNVIPINFGTFQIPSDGDQRSAASVNVGLEANGDRTVFLLDRLGANFIGSTFVVNTVDADSAASWANVTCSLANTWYQLTGASWDQVGVLAGEVAEVDITGTLQWQPPSTATIMLACGYMQWTPGNTPTNTQKLPASGQQFIVESTGSGLTVGFHLKGIVTITANGNVRWSVLTQVNGQLATPVNLIGNYTVGVKTYRPTGFAL